MKIRTLVAAIYLGLTGCASAPNPVEMVFVGYIIGDDCEELINLGAIATIPINFKINPVEAAKSLPHGFYGCSSKFMYSVYADRESYYFVNYNYLFLKSRNVMNIRKYSFIVSPQTGKLISTPEYAKKKIK